MKFIVTIEYNIHMGTIRWETQGTCPSHFFRQWWYNYAMPPTFFSLGFVAYWFYTKLSLSHFTIKLHLWI